MGHPALEATPREKDRDLPVFIHYHIDELNLTLEAFRVYFYLARRYGDGRLDAIGSYKTIGEHCFRESYPCASPATLKRKAITAVNQLLEKGLIEKYRYQANDGSSIQNSYRILGKEELRENKVIPFPKSKSKTSSPSANAPSSANASEGEIAPPLKNTTAKDTPAKNTRSERAKNFSKQKNKSDIAEQSEMENTKTPVEQSPMETPNSQYANSLNTNKTENGDNFSENSLEKEKQPDPYWTGHQEKVVDLQRKRAFKDSIGNAPFESVEEMNQFQEELTEYARLTGKRSPSGFAHSILKEMKESGYEHPYWKEWKSGEQMGSHEMQEWEAMPGQPYPYFVNYLKENLKRQDYTDAQALQQANWICSNPQHAKPHWEQFKIRVENEAEQKSKQAELGCESYVAPTWARQKTVSDEEAVSAIAQINEGTEPPKLGNNSIGNSDNAQDSLDNSDKQLPSEASQDAPEPEDEDGGDYYPEDAPLKFVKAMLRQPDFDEFWTNRFSKGFARNGVLKALAHASPQEEYEIYQLLLGNETARSWAIQKLEQDDEFDF